MKYTVLLLNIQTKEFYHKKLIKHDNSVLQCRVQRLQFPGHQLPVNVLEVLERQSQHVQVPGVCFWKERLVLRRFHNFGKPESNR